MIIIKELITKSKLMALMQKGSCCGHGPLFRLLFRDCYYDLMKTRLKTKRHLIVRCREHLGINKAGQKIKSNSSSIGDHISKSGHKASFDDFEIISKTDNHFDLLIHESLLIKRDTPSLNSQTSSIPMVLIWFCLIRSCFSSHILVLVFFFFVFLFTLPY